MSDITLLDLQNHAPAGDQPTCEECVGSGGWYRYEPAVEPEAGMLYLSCVQCRGSGRTAFPRD